MNPNKLSKEQADILVLEAHEQMRIFPRLRLGRAIFQLLKLKQISTILGSDRDFFHVQDDCKALEMFMLYCVNEPEGG